MPQSIMYICSKYAKHLVVKMLGLVTRNDLHELGWNFITVTLTYFTIGACFICLFFVYLFTFMKYMSFSKIDQV